MPEEDRWRHNGHRGGVLWMTGLSGAGKSTLAFSLEQYLFRKGYQVYVLDGDNIRHGLCSDLGFSPEDRVENIRRVGHAAALFARAGFLVITAFISPYRSDRDRVRSLAPEFFHEVLRRRGHPHLRGARPQGPLCQGAPRRDRGLHRRLRALRAAGAGGAADRHGQALH